VVFVDSDRTWPCRLRLLVIHPHRKWRLRSRDGESAFDLVWILFAALPVPAQCRETLLSLGSGPHGCTQHCSGSKLDSEGPDYRSCVWRFTPHGTCSTSANRR